MMSLFNLFSQTCFVTGCWIQRTHIPELHYNEHVCGICYHRGRATCL